MKSSFPEIAPVDLGPIGYEGLLGGTLSDGGGGGGTLLETREGVPRRRRRSGRNRSPDSQVSLENDDIWIESKDIRGL